MDFIDIKDRKIEISLIIRIVLCATLMIMSIFTITEWLLLKKS